MKTKTILKRALTLLLTLLMLFSTTTIGISAAQVEVAETGADIKGYIFYDNTYTKWSNVQVMIGHGSWSEGYLMTRIANTNLWYYNMTSTWGGATQICVFNASTKWGGEGSSPTHRSGYMDQNSAVKNFSTSYTSGLLLYGTSGSDNFALSMSSKSYSTLNTNQTVQAHSKKVGATTYTADAAAGTVKVSGYRLSGSTTAASSSATTTLNSNSSTYASIARSATVTLTATASAGYNFVGWYNSSGTRVSTSTTYSYTCSGSAATYTARFDQKSVTATFVDHDGTVLDTQTIAYGSAPSKPTNPTRTGYTFKGWDKTIAAITANTTYTAQYDVNTHTVTVTAEPAEGGTVTGGGTYDYGSNATLLATPNSADSYAFTGWTLSGTAGTDYEIIDGSLSSLNLTIKVYNNVTATASFVQAVTHTVRASANISGAGTVGPVNQEVPEGGSITLTASANEGYRFDRWQISGSYTPAGNLSSPNLSITPTGDVTATAIFVKTYKVTFVDYDGTVLKATQTVDAGTAATAPDDPTRANYTFAGWSTTFNNVQSDLTVTATYEGNEYTVTVGSATGGSATANGLASDTVNYNEPVTLVATPAEGYVFTGWQLSPSNYEGDVNLKNAEITIIPTANITATPTFAEAQYLTVHSFSANGCDKLTVTENGTVTVDGVTQPNEKVFGNDTWKTSDVIIIDNSTSEVTASLNSADSQNNWYVNGEYLVSDDYYTIVFENNWMWSDVSLYAWNSDGNNSWPGVEMKQSVDSTTGYDVYVYLVPITYDYIIINGIKNDGSGNRDQTPNIDLSALTPGTVTDYCMVWNDKNDVGESGITEDIATRSEDINLTDTLFTEGVWNGVEEVWITDTGIVTLRNALAEAIDDTTETYNGGTNSNDYTVGSWTAFTAAYGHAYRQLGSSTATQDVIDAAVTSLMDAYNALETNSYVPITVTQTGDDIGSVKVGDTTITTSTGSVDVTVNSNFNVIISAPAGYYIASISGIVNEVNKVGTFATSVTVTTTGEINVVYAPNPTVTVNHSVTGGTATVDDVDASSPVSVTYGGTPTVYVDAPDGYYIEAITVDGVAIDEIANATPESYLEYEFALSSVQQNRIINVTYGLRATYTISIEYSNELGDLMYGDQVLADGDVITVYSNENVTITAVPNAPNHGISFWVIDDAVVGFNNTSYTFSNIADNHTVVIEWKVLDPITVTVGTNNALAGSATASTGEYRVTNGILGENDDVLQQSVIDLTANILDPCYEFVSWTIEGGYAIKSGDIYSKNLSIYANSPLQITANYELTYRKIYVDNNGGWSNVYFYIYNDKEIYKEWPGTEMTYDSSVGYYVGYVPIDASGTIMFHKYPDTTQTIRQEYSGTDFTENNLFKTYVEAGGDGSSIYVPDGYYIQGVWNGEEHNALDLIQFNRNEDGTYSVTLDITSAEAGAVTVEGANQTNTTFNAEEGVIYVNPSDENSRFYQATASTATTSGQTLNTIGSSFVPFPSRTHVKVQIPNYNPEKNYKVTFTFDPETLEFSWVIEEEVPTVDVIITDGRDKNEGDIYMDTPNDRVGNSYFDDATVHSQVEHFYYNDAQVVAGTATTFYTQVNKNSNTGGYDYYVAGWVLNGTEFIPASDMGNGLYSGSYVFTEEADLVPVYFHTDAWLEKTGTQTAHVYIIADPDIVNWDKYMAAYVWYKVGGVDRYVQFGSFPGQLMIPVTGLPNTYYTIIETSDGEELTISGITLSNYANGEDIDVSIHPFGYSNIQTYDYFDPVVLLQQGRDNITFEIKDTNDTINKDRVHENENEDLTNGNWDFVPYTDYNGDYIDISGTVIENYDELSDDNALYIIREGYVNVDQGVLSGDFYVRNYFYNAAGEYLGWCYTNELCDPTHGIWDVIGTYGGQKVYVSYECVSHDDRYDGQWYSDIDVSVTINLSVNVGLTTDGGNSFTIDAVDDVNVADYGSGYINATLQNIDVERGTSVKLTATPASGYKFIGWYAADRTLFSSNPTVTVFAAVATSYTAVFEKLEEGYYYVNHYLYTGVGTSTIYIPTAHGGSGQLYVGIENLTDNTVDPVALKETNSAYIKAKENDELLITIATDASGADTFFSWYVETLDSTGTTFEEVGVNSADNLYNNGGDIIGSKDMVYFQFKYKVKEGDSYSMTLFSDLISVSVNRKIVYNYNDRYGNIKTYVVPVTLTAKEIEGFDGNELKPYTPAYITVDGHVNTVLANAPFVDDLYKDLTWTITSTMFDEITFEFWATQADTEYMVTLNYEGQTEIVHAKFNEALTISSIDLFGINSEAKGIWFHDVDEDGVFDQGTDVILAYGLKLGHVVTADMYVTFMLVDDYDFGVSLEEPVYGREQSTDSEGNNVTDKVIVDYIVNFLTPEMYVKGDEPTYRGQTITGENWEGYSYTLEDMVLRHDYTFEYGVILEQVGSFREDKMEDFTYEKALEAAQAAGYGTPSSTTVLNYVAANINGSAKYQNKYYSVYNNNNVTLNNLTNKNRLLFTISYTNNEVQRGKYFNVYGYIKVTDADDNVTYYFSNSQTLNIYETAIATV